jgi:glycosyltransferase involved in cell wall biosynthesis
MKISVITVAYNSVKTIQSTLESVLGQAHQDVEHILVDGNSTDGTQALIRSYERENLRWISEPDQGIYDAMNKGLQIATGEIIGFLNADDFYKDANVLTQVASTFQQWQVDSVYSDLAYVDEEDTTKIIRFWKSGPYKPGSFLLGWMPPHPTFFAKRAIYQQYEGFDVRLKSAADYELMLRFIHKHQISIAYIPQVLVMMRTGGISNRNVLNRLKANTEDRRAWQMNNLHPYPFTLLLKPLRKIEQFLFNSHKKELKEQLNGYSAGVKLGIHSNMATLHVN